MITLLGNLFQNSGNSIGYFHACFMKLHNTIAERKRNGKNMGMGSLGLVDRKWDLPTGDPKHRLFLCLKHSSICYATWSQDLLFLYCLAYYNMLFHHVHAASNKGNPDQWNIWRRTEETLALEEVLWSWSCERHQSPG